MSSFIFNFSRACFYESRATYPVTIVCACLLVCLLACLWTAVVKNIQQVVLVFLTIQFSVAKVQQVVLLFLKI